jgi:hypothetical protein
VISLVDYLVARNSTHGAAALKAEVLDGILQLLEAVQWGSICVPDTCGLLSSLCQLAAAEGRLSGTSFTARSFYRKIALPILDNFGRPCCFFAPLQCQSFPYPGPAHQLPLTRSTQHFLLRILRVLLVIACVPAVA